MCKSAAASKQLIQKVLELVMSSMTTARYCEWQRPEAIFLGRLAHSFGAARAA